MRIKCFHYAFMKKKSALKKMNLTQLIYGWIFYLLKLFLGHHFYVLFSGYEQHTLGGQDGALEEH